MRCQSTLKAFQFGIAFAIAASPAVALAQQGQGAELPPPTLDAPAAAPAPTSAPVAAAAPASPPATAAQTSRASAPASSAEQPWYKRMWGSVTGWFSGDDGAQPAAPAPAPQPKAAAPAPQPRASGVPVEGYAVDSPERTIRTGVLGECVKTGTWREGMQVMECGGAASTEAVAKAEPAAAAPAPAPTPEPVEVQPLPTPAEEPQAPLAAEPAPEPQPAPMPPPAPREMVTLSADALFAVNSDVLKPTAKESLDEMARKLRDMEYDSVKVVGHTDPTGSVALNDRLSKRRAEAVKRHLVEQGVPAEKISAQGVGSSMPVVDAKSCASLAKGQRAACFQADRRVDIEVTGTIDPMAKQ